jgi:hypothetical protein
MLNNSFSPSNHKLHLLFIDDFDTLLNTQLFFKAQLIVNSPFMSEPFCKYHFFLPIFCSFHLCPPHLVINNKLLLVTNCCISYVLHTLIHWLHYSLFTECMSHPVVTMCILRKQKNPDKT